MSIFEQAKSKGFIMNLIGVDTSKMQYQVDRLIEKSIENGVNVTKKDKKKLYKMVTEMAEVMLKLDDSMNLVFEVQNKFLSKYGVINDEVTTAFLTKKYNEKMIEANGEFNKAIARFTMVSDFTLCKEFYRLALTYKNKGIEVDEDFINSQLQKINNIETDRKNNQLVANISEYFLGISDPNKRSGTGMVNAKRKINTDVEKVNLDDLDTAQLSMIDKYVKTDKEALQALLKNKTFDVNKIQLF